MRTSRKTDLRLNKDLRSSKNNFRGHGIAQGLDREPPSLSPHFLFPTYMFRSKLQLDLNTKTINSSLALTGVNIFK